jgi:ABC-type thiamin/hydroxymethylpyrimidine transport system permease subunit
MDYDLTGKCLLVLGLAILFATLYLGYTLYAAVMQTGANPAPQKQINITSNAMPSVGGIISAIVSSIASQMPLAIYTSYAIAAIILALFASIGYKISSLGIRMFTVGRDKNANANE